MTLAPLPNAFAVFLSAEVILILRLLPPAALALGFALPAAGGLGAVALVVRITALGKKQEFAMAALAPEGGLHRQARQPEPPPPPEPPRGHSPNQPRPSTKRNQMKKSFVGKRRRKSTASPSDFQIAQFIRLSDRRWHLLGAEQLEPFFDVWEDRRNAVSRKRLRPKRVTDEIIKKPKRTKGKVITRRSPLRLSAKTACACSSPRTSQSPSYHSNRNRNREVPRSPNSNQANRVSDARGSMHFTKHRANRVVLVVCLSQPVLPQPLSSLRQCRNR